MADAKHLELLQASIQRLAGNGLAIKGWSITLLTAILGAAIKEHDAAYALCGLGPIWIFWTLDAYYLALERGFRRKYEDAATLARGGKAPTFDMTPPALTAGTWLEALIAPSVLLSYGPAMGLLVAVAGVLVAGARGA